MDILAALRERTRSGHRAIETAIPILDPELDLPRYRRILAAFFGFYAPVETAVSALWDGAGLAGPWAARRKLPALARDLEALGLESEARARLPRMPSPPPLPDLAASLGCMYVLEGSTLGARLIAPRLAERLGLGPANGAAFYHGYGEHTGAMWRTFGDLLVARLPAERAETAIAAAVDTFTGLRLWFREALAW